MKMKNHRLNQNHGGLIRFLIPLGLLIALASIVIYVNFYKLTAVWDFIGYIVYYVLSVFAFTLLWNKCTIFSKGLLLTIALYEIYEFSMDILEISNPYLHKLIYTSRNINYILCGLLGLFMIAYPLIYYLRNK